MSASGIKIVTEENWLNPDEIFQYIIDSKPYIKARSIEVSDYYVKVIQPITLNESVPEEIHTMFEVAKGAMIYGYFFYPLFTIGLEHLNKIAEACIRIKYKTTQQKENKLTFYKMIEYLHANKIISDEARRRWHMMRELRNSASHPEGQKLLPPAMIIETLKALVKDINNLFIWGIGD